MTSDGNDEDTERGIVYSADHNPAVDGDGVTKVSMGTGSGTFSNTVYTFDTSATYYVRAYAANDAGTVYGAEIELNTLASADITLGSAALTGCTYYYPNASVSGDSIRTILISFSDNVTNGDSIILPPAPEGFTVSSSSASNNYTKRINLDAGRSGKRCSGLYTRYRVYNRKRDAIG